ncbi:MAG TPA: neutral zinc metallopeptidase [Candidatus Limnocylindria bacterium]|nr:neutral zinc metallopeptidase [Candidatus Limnocylindria bacterium]
MRWRPSQNTQIEDRRGAGGLGGGGMRMGGLGGGGIPLPVGGGLGGIVLIVIVFIVMQFLGGGLGGSQGEPGSTSAPSDQMGQFVNSVTVDVQTFWDEQFRAANKDYPETVTVLFTEGTQTGCGAASSATGPFYCPADEKVYLDPGFFDELSRRFGAPGDFAQAYVIAHEYGHRVQDVLGTMDQVQSEQQSNPGQANELSVRLELQADCLAGMWANWVMAHPDQANVESITDEDVREGLTAASAVGDDRIQEQATGTIDKEAWTHGSAEQRMKWFNVGFKQGSLEACDTFAVATP